MIELGIQTHCLWYAVNGFVLLVVLVTGTQGAERDTFMAASFFSTTLPMETEMNNEDERWFELSRLH